MVEKISLAVVPDSEEGELTLNHMVQVNNKILNALDGVTDEKGAYVVINLDEIKKPPFGIKMSELFSSSRDLFTHENLSLAQITTKSILIKFFGNVLEGTSQQRVIVTNSENQSETDTKLRGVGIKHSGNYTHYIEGFSKETDLGQV